MKTIALVYGYGQLEDGELDEQTIGRCKKALELYQNKEVDEIHITVGVSRDGILMGEKMGHWFVGWSVCSVDVIVTPFGLNTAGETAICNEVIHKTTKVIAVSSWYHLPRIWLLWLWRGRRVRLVGSDEGIHRKDILIEPVKLVNSTLRPFCSARFVK